MPSRSDSEKTWAWRSDGGRTSSASTPPSATVRLGAREELHAHAALVEDGVLRADVALPLRCEVSVRYRGVPRSARLSARADRGLLVEFDEPATAVVPGQYAVFYAGDRVLGGGAIKESWASPPAEPS